MSPPTDPRPSAVADTDQQSGSLLFSRLRFGLTALTVAALDLWSKHWIFANLPPNTSRAFIPNFIDFHRHLNTGAVFGSFTGQVSVFVIASLLALVFVCYVYWRTNKNQWFTQIALGLVLAGAIGNLYDRLKMEADVVVQTTANGELRESIGVIVEETDAEIRLGSWPEGADVRRFRRGDVETRRQCVVRDFIQFTSHFPDWVPKFGGRPVWPWVFNVADAALVCGVIALLLTTWFDGKPKEQEESTQQNV